MVTPIAYRGTATAVAGVVGGISVSEGVATAIGAFLAQPAVFVVGGVGLTALCAFLIYQGIHQTKPGQKTEYTVETPHGKASITVEKVPDYVEIVAGPDCSAKFSKSVVDNPDCTNNLTKLIEALAAVSAIHAGSAHLIQNTAMEDGKVTAYVECRLNGAPLNTEEIVKAFREKQGGEYKAVDSEHAA